MCLLCFPLLCSIFSLCFFFRVLNFLVSSRSDFLFTLLWMARHKRKEKERDRKKIKKEKLVIIPINIISVIPFRCVFLSFPMLHAPPSSSSCQQEYSSLCAIIMSVLMSIFHNYYIIRNLCMQ